MVCIVCLKDNSPVNISIRYESIQFETQTCVEHGNDIQNIVRKYIRKARETAVIAESEQTGKDKKKDWKSTE